MQHRAARSRRGRFLLWACIGYCVREYARPHGYLWSAENHLADALSRLESEKLPLPPLLAKVPRTLVSKGGLKILGNR